MCDRRSVGCTYVLYFVDEITVKARNGFVLFSPEMPTINLRWIRLAISVIIDYPLKKIYFNFFIFLGRESFAAGHFFFPPPLFASTYRHKYRQEFKFPVSSGLGFSSGWDKFLNAIYAVQKRVKGTGDYRVPRDDHVPYFSMCQKFKIIPWAALKFPKCPRDASRGARHASRRNPPPRCIYQRFALQEKPNAAKKHPKRKEKNYKRKYFFSRFFRRCFCCFRFGSF